MNSFEKHMLKILDISENQYRPKRSGFSSLDEVVSRLVGCLNKKDLDGVKKTSNEILHYLSPIKQETFYTIKREESFLQRLKPLEDWLLKAYSNKLHLLDFLKVKGQSSYYKDLGKNWSICINYSSENDIVTTAVELNNPINFYLKIVTDDRNRVDLLIYTSDERPIQSYFESLINAAVFYLKYIDEEPIQFQKTKELITSLLESSNRENTKDVIDLGNKLKNKLTELIKAKSKYNDCILYDMLKPLEELVVKLYTKGELYRKVFLEEKHTRFFNVTPYGFSVEILPNKPIIGDILYSLNNGNKSTLCLEASNREEVEDTNRKSMDITKNRLSTLEYSELLINAISFYHEYVNGITINPAYESSLELESKSESDKKQNQESIEQNEFDLKYYFDGEEYNITFRGRKITLVKVNDGRDFFLIGENILLINWEEQEDYKLNLEDYDILNILEHQFNIKIDRNKIKPYPCDTEQKQFEEKNNIKEALQKIINSL